ncbi:MAG: ABC transporter ATP-binding protein [Acidobacteriia bacterium]|nr:ABC transporter ATP-binding protein [Terriglobia bacterium]
MTDVAIRCEGLAKQYRIGERESYTALRDVITDAFASPFRRLRSALRHSPNGSTRKKMSDFWALKDVSFEIKRGEVVGIIGRNGAGKSTLLKILSRITEPTRGQVDIWGRVGSLLEVGTGFHPELTGRDNIFLNGAILGMRRAEIARKFDEIVAFAEVEKFIDTPVKRYSSGMYVRLAFAVAAHMETEILMVDEVLAVGDAQFQKKCLGKMQSVATREGRTVLFVSHNMAAVRHLCSKGIYLVAGTVQCIGNVEETIRASLSAASREQDSKHVSANGLELVEFKLCALGSLSALTSAIFSEDYEFRFTVGGDSGVRVAPVLRLYDDSGTLISSICGPEEGLDFAPTNGSCEWVVKMPSLQLFPGHYSVALQIFGHEPQPFLEVRNAFDFTVEAALIPGATRSYRTDHGLIRICGGIFVTEKRQ